jgi:ABC-2 type transport system permease protein
MLLAGGASLAMANSSVSRTASVTDGLGYMLFITSPLLTMRLGYGKSGIDRALFSAPVRMANIIAGKYLSAVAVLAAALAVSFVYPVMIAAWGDISWSETFAGYLGLLLLGAALISAGMFVSSFPLGRPAAGVLTVALMLLILLFQAVIPGISSAWLRLLMTKVSPSYHMHVFGTGLINFSSVVYFISFILLFLLMAAGIIQRRRA